jgi:hypothetical protein
LSGGGGRRKGREGRRRARRKAFAAGSEEPETKRSPDALTPSVFLIDKKSEKKKQTSPPIDQ